MAPTINVGRGLQTDPTLLRYASAITKKKEMLEVVGSKLCLPTSLRPFERGARDGAVVRALASHQCGPGSNPGVDAIM